MFFWNELIASVYMLLLNMLGYHFLGLDGLGISFLFGYLIYLLQVYFISQKLYTFLFRKEFFLLMSVQVFLGALSFLCSLWMPAPWSYIPGVLLIGLSCLYSFIEMNKRLNLKEVWTKIKKGKNG